MPWTVGGIDVDAQADLELTASTLSLSAIVPDADLGPWRTLGERAGDLDVQTAYGGQFRAFGRGEASTITVSPPADQSPPFATSEWYVSAFDVEAVAADRSEVRVDLQRPTPRDDAFAIADEALVPSQSGLGRNFGTDFGGATRVAGDAGFGNDFGVDFGVGDVDLAVSIGLRGGDAGSLGLEARQVGRATESEAATGTEYELPVMLTDEQAAAFADAAGTPAAIVDRSIPDGDSFAVDSSGGRQTVVVDVQSDGLGPPSGTWGVADWQLTEQQPTGTRRWRASLSLRELSS